MCVYIYMYTYMYVAAGHRVSRPRGTGSVGVSVGEGQLTKHSRTETLLPIILLGKYVNLEPKSAACTQI